MIKLKIEDFKLFYDGHEGLPCKVPCTLYSVLVGHGVIEDPYFRDNEKKYIDVARKDFDMEACFDANADLLGEERIELKFAGIDTLADVYLNDVFLGSTDNMHHGWSFPVKGILKEGSNLLQVHFFSPIGYTERENEKFPLYSPAESLPGYAHMRKTFCSFGWDWGPVIPDSGFYREVCIEGHSGAELLDVYVRQKHTDGEVILTVENRVGFCSEEVVSYELLDPCGKKVAEGLSACNAAFEIKVNSPALWWPNGYGKQPLYELKTRLLHGKTLLGEKTQKLGLRTLTVSTAKDKWGNEFCFVVNGKKIFSMGANFIPMDALLPRVNEEKTRFLLKECVAANFNTVRVWGGGYYPDDYFYTICDELGLIVWQDFMFACSTVYLNERLEQSVRREFTEFITRVRNHACLGLLCGNNEIEMAWTCWNLPPDVRQKEDYIRLFERILPDLCDALCPDTFYWRSSPSSVGGFVDPASEDRGDAHCWSIWHGGEPFEKYREKYIRFCSEYGYEAFPSVKTLRTIALEEDMNPFSPVMDAHQKGAGGNARIVAKTADYFRYVFSLEDFVYITQLLQAEAIRYGAEHFRRNRGRCMGSLYWQLNDNWQTASWSSIDYCGRWKALHYYARRFYAPVLLSVCDDGLSCTFNISNETRETFVGKVEWAVMKKDFTCVANGEIEVKVGELSAKDIAVIDLNETVKGHESEYFLAYRLYKGREKVSENCTLFCKPKCFDFDKDPAFDIEVRNADEEHFSIEIRANSFVKDLELDLAEGDCRFSDNFFSLLSPAGKHITCEKQGRTAEQLRALLLVRCVNKVS